MKPECTVFGFKGTEGIKRIDPMLAKLATANNYDERIADLE